MEFGSCNNFDYDGCNGYSPLQCAWVYKFKGRYGKCLGLSSSDFRCDDIVAFPIRLDDGSEKDEKLMSHVNRCSDAGCVPIDVSRDGFAETWLDCVSEADASEYACDKRIMPGFRADALCEGKFTIRKNDVCGAGVGGASCIADDEAIRNHKRHARTESLSGAMLIKNACRAKNACDHHLDKDACRHDPSGCQWKKSKKKKNKCVAKPAGESNAGFCSDNKKKVDCLEENNGGEWCSWDSTTEECNDHQEE